MKSCNERTPNLEGEIVVLLLLVGPQSVPPLPQDLADCPVVLVGMSLVHQGSVALAEDHERIHGTTDVVFLPLVGDWKEAKKEQRETNTRKKTLGL